MRRAIRFVCFAIAGLILLLATAWAMGALYFDLPVRSLRAPLAIIYGLAVLATITLIRNRWRGMALAAISFAVVVAWWLTLQPRQDRDWKPEVATLGFAVIE